MEGIKHMWNSESHPKWGWQLPAACSSRTEGPCFEISFIFLWEQLQQCGVTPRGGSPGSEVCTPQRGCGVDTPHLPGAPTATLPPPEPIPLAHPREEQSHPQNRGTWPCPITDPVGLLPPAPAATAELQRVPLLDGEKHGHGSASSGHSKV